MKNVGNQNGLAKKNGDFDREFGFLGDIRLTTWGMISGALHVWYHECDEYYQIEVECELLDGWGEIFPVTLHLTAESDEAFLVERYRQEYQIGSIHRIECNIFSFKKNIMLYGPLTTPVKDDEKNQMSEWFAKEI